MVTAAAEAALSTETEDPRTQGPVSWPRLAHLWQLPAVLGTTVRDTAPTPGQQTGFVF